MTLRDGDTGETFKYVQLTDRYVNWWNRVAKALQENFADRMIGAWAYESYVNPPLRERVHPQVGIGFVGFGRRWVDDYERAEDRRSWAGWAEKTDFMMYRPNTIDIASIAFPLNYTRRVAEDITWLHANGMQAAEGGQYGHWSALGLAYYVRAKLYWDPDVDVEALIEDYCRAGFGPAADQVRAYFDLLETMTDEIAALEGAHSEQGVIWRSRQMEAIGQAPPRMWLAGAEDQPGVDVEALGDDMEQEIEAAPDWARRRAIPRERMRLIAMVFVDYQERLDALLTEAEQIAATHPDPSYARRVAFLRYALTYAEVCAKPLIYWYDADTDEVEAWIDRRLQFLRGVTDRYALDVPRILERHARYGMGHGRGYHAREREHHLPLSP